MNYYEILGLDENVSSDDAISEAYSKAQSKWQTMLNQGIGKQAQLARQIMDNGELEQAYETLIDPSKRQQYKRSLELARETGNTVSGAGNIQVKFTLGGGFGDYTFMVVDNPIRHALKLNGNLLINSIQEYVCRVWEDPDLGTEAYSDRSLERWIYYSAGDSDMANALRYFKWSGYQSTTKSLMYQSLDLLQTRYPVPFLPCGQDNLIQQTAEFEKPRFEVFPKVVNLGLISRDRISVPVFIRWWKKHPGKIIISTDNPALQIKSSNLDSDFQFFVEIDGTDLKRGDIVTGNVSITSEFCGEIQIPVLGAKQKIMGNKSFGQEINLKVAQEAMVAQDFITASRTFRLAGAPEDEKKAILEIIRSAYNRHEWMGVIEKTRQFHSRYGRQRETLMYLIESARMVGGTHYQLGQYERAVEYLATLAYETAYLEDKKLPEGNWTIKGESQIRLHHDDPKSDWVNIAETLDLRWTHGEGNSDQSKYAGPMPLDLKTRNIVWITNSSKFKPPIVAYEGVLVVRSKDNRSVMGLDAASGQVIWQHTQGLTGKDISAPVAGGSNVFVTDPSGKLYCLGILTGNVKWVIQLKDSRDLSLSLEGNLLCVGTGKQVLIIDAQDGTELTGTEEMMGFLWRGANPVNLLLTDGCCLFQKSALRKQTMAFIDLDSGESIEYDIPYSVKPPATWAAYDGEIYIPLLVTKEMRRKYRDSEGKSREKTEIVWDELVFSVYGVRTDKRVALIETPLGTYPTQLPGDCDIYIKNVKTAGSCAVAPIYTEKSGDMTTIFPPQEGKHLHRMIAASFGRDIYYWISTENVVEIANYRRVDSDVQSILFANVHDLVVSSTSLSTSLAGNTDDDYASNFVLPDAVRPIVGTPALYGDMIYVVSRTGEVVAIGR